MIDYIYNNKEWLFSGVGLAIFGLIYRNLFHKNSSANPRSENNNIHTVSPTQDIASNPVSATKNLDACKSLTRILFIDDDIKFKVVQILVNSGWKYTKAIKDAKSLDCPEILESHILFVDIQGVGKQLSFSDEGLGLAYALKEKYPNKKVVIYSAESKGDRFHRALKKVDSFLNKNADPYEFQQIVEEFCLDHE